MNPNKNSIKTLIAVLLASAPASLVRASEIQFTINNNAGMTVHYGFYKTKLTGAVIQKYERMAPIEVLSSGSSSTSSAQLPQSLFAKVKASVTSKFSTKTTEPASKKSYKKSTGIKRITEYTRLIASTNKDILLNKINGKQLSSEEKKLVTSKLVPQSIKPHCKRTVTFTIDKDKLIKRSGGQEYWSLSITADDRHLDCSFDEQQEQEGIKQQSQLSSAEQFMKSATKLRKKIEMGKGDA